VTAATSARSDLGRIGLVATDLDGTLLRSDGSVSDRTVAALHAVADAGVAVVFVTGRPWRYLGDVLERTGVGGRVICGNGALVWDSERAEPVLVRGFDPEVLRAVLSRIRTALPNALFAAEQVQGMAHEVGFNPRITAGHTRLVVLDDVIGEPVLKLLVRVSLGADLDDLRSRVDTAVAGDAEVTFSSTYSEALLELSAAGVDKGTALARHAGGLGIDVGRVLAVGDMPNDIPMLRWAGVGVAVAGAHPDVVAAADRTTAGNDEDGVALLLEELLAAR
jgi:Cof subfamily protein (haloacid dehalogenase superfamily)